MLKRISIDELQPGMFVEKVLTQKGTLKIKTQGFVRTPKAVTMLRQKGILEVAIDPSKILPGQEEQSAESNDASTAKIPDTTHPPHHRTASFDKEMGEAKVLYNEAMQLQKRAIRDIKNGNPVDIQPVQKLADSFIDSVFRNQDALAFMCRIREKDAYLLQHSINVSILITILAKHMNFDREVIHALATGALLHDLGKVRVPDEILNKPGRLTPEEMAEMRRHVEYSVDILALSPDIQAISVDIAQNHHERLDGTGYPSGLDGDKLSKWSRMIAVVDSYDAMTADRCYKEGMNPIKAFKILKKESGVNYDGSIVDVFIKAMGIHPVGSLVKLKSQKLAIVTQSNFNSPLAPVVKTFYHTKFNHYTEVKDIDLSDKKIDDEIEASVKPEDFRIDLLRFFRTAFLN